MNVVISVIGTDQVGILAHVSTLCSKYDANIVEVSQTVLSSTFAMIMVANIEKLNVSFDEFVDNMKASGKEKCVEINVMHEDIFNSMHKI